MKRSAPLPYFGGSNREYYEQEYRETLITGLDPAILVTAFMRLLGSVPKSDMPEEELLLSHRARARYRREKREAAAEIARLKEVRGVGERTARRLLQRFGSLGSIARASTDELTEIPYVTRHIASQIKRLLRRTACR